MREHNYVGIALIIGAFVLLGATSVIAAHGSKVILVVYVITTTVLMMSITEGAKAVTKAQGVRFNNQSVLVQGGILGTIFMVALSALGF